MSAFFTRRSVGSGAAPTDCGPRCRRSGAACGRRSRRSTPPANCCCRALLAQRILRLAQPLAQGGEFGLQGRAQLGQARGFGLVGSDLARKSEGTGLGLPLAKRFVELHGGSIGLSSAIGRGSTFTVRMPLRPSGACE
jgi:hypothetical protein